MSALVAMLGLFVGLSSTPFDDASSADHVPRVSMHTETVDLPTFSGLQHACEQVGLELGLRHRELVVRAASTATTADFVRATGRRWFEAAAFTHGTIWLQPAAVLSRFSHVDEIFRHECVHAWLHAEGLGGLPRLVEEAVATGLSGQAARLPPAQPFAEAELAEAEARLATPKDRQQLTTTVSRAVQTFWRPLSNLSHAQRVALLRGVHQRAAADWLCATLPDGTSLYRLLHASGSNARVPRACIPAFAAPPPQEPAPALTRDAPRGAKEPPKP